MTPNPMKVLCAAADAMYRSVLVGDPCPSTRRLGDFVMGTPERGDVLLEVSTRGDDPSRVGTLLSTVDGAVCEHEHDDPEAEPGSCRECPPCPDRCGDCPACDRRWSERYVWLERLETACGAGRDACSDRSCIHRHRWFNASFIRVPTLGQLRALSNGATSSTEVTDFGFRLRGPVPRFAGGSLNLAGLVARERRPSGSSEPQRVCRVCWSAPCELHAPDDWASHDDHYRANGATGQRPTYDTLSLRRHSFTYGDSTGRLLFDRRPVEPEPDGQELVWSLLRRAAAEHARLVSRGLPRLTAAEVQAPFVEVGALRVDAPTEGSS